GIRMISFTFGADYYPEHWPRERWETDAKLMRELGLDVVRMGEFSWFKMEPEEGRFDFDWLDEAIALLASHGIKTILGTPTAAPPAWIIEGDPTIEPMDDQGRRRHFGGRHHDCQSHPGYRAHIRRFVTAYAKHFGPNPNVIGWQVDNELGNSHDELCFCPHCENRFRKWLQNRYGTVDELNRHWGTAFWSQGYNSFEQVHAPRMTAAGKNPSQELDWKRFCSDLILEFHDFQAKILRSFAPDKFITQNMMGFSDKVSYYALGSQLEFASHDQYPGGFFLGQPSPSPDSRQAADLDFIRSVKQSPFAIMEQQSGITGWQIMGRAPRPGQLGVWAAQSVAHGADAIVFFRWRSCAMGTEQYWHGLLPHSGIPGRTYREAAAFIRAMKPVMQEIKGAMPRAEAAILYSYDQEYAIRIQPHHPSLNYIEHLRIYYQALYRRSVPLDFVSEDQDFSPYKALIAPLHYLNSPESTNKLLSYAENGGNLVLTMRAGVKAMDNTCLTDGPLPVGFSEAAGVTVEEYDCLLYGENSVVWDGVSYSCRKWCDILSLNGAEALARYGQAFYTGAPAIVRRAYGKGIIYYVGTEMGDALAARFAEELISRAGLSSLGNVPAGVELACRWKGKQGWLFALNHTDREQPCSIPDGWSPLSGTASGTLAPDSFAVFTKEGKA
ncbi:MAG: beta-galactosidase, partial [Clostridia bacterium]|nr:beta-galactosidase [Clostridia bacterium]